MREAILLAFVLFVGASYASAQVTSGDFVYSLNDANEATITVYIGAGGAVDIPDAIDGYPVKKIGNSAFRLAANLTGVKIPDSVTTIENYAFYYASLTSVTNHIIARCRCEKDHIIGGFT